MLKQLIAVAGLLLALGGAAHAEVTCDAARPGENKQQEFQRLLDCTRQSILDAKTRLNFLSDMKMDELEAGLERERDILNGLIETRNAALNAANADNAKLKDANDELTRELTAANQKNDEDNARIAALQAEVERLAAELKDAHATIEVDNGKIAALQAVIDQLQAQLTELNDNLKAAKEQQAALEKKIDELTTALNDASKNVTEQATALGKQITDLKTALDDANKQIDALNAHIDELNGALAGAEVKIAELSTKLDQTTAALTVATQKIVALEKDIADLSAKLAEAEAKLKDAMDKLGPFRIAIFLGLAQIFQGDQNVYVIGNRLIVAEEVLFPTGSAAISASGRSTILKVANFVKSLQPQYPEDREWVLQVDGHTDLRPIKNKHFRSNWELSTARAVEVVKVLQSQCIPPIHLAAAGFGEYQPLATGRDPETLRHNRRIEMEITHSGLSGVEPDPVPVAPGCQK